MTLANISEKTGINLGLILVLLGVLGSSFGTAVVAVYRVGQLETRADKHDVEAERVKGELYAEIKEGAKTANEYDKRISVVETTITSMNATLGRIEGKLDQQVVNARGGR